MPQETPHTKSNMLLINATTWVVFKSFSWTNNQSQKSTFWCSHLYKIVKQENVILTIESWSLMAWAQEWVLGLIPKQKNIIFWEGRRTGILHLVGSSWMSVYNSQKSLNYALKMGTKAVLTTGDQIKHEEWLLFQIPREFPEEALECPSYYSQKLLKSAPESEMESWKNTGFLLTAHWGPRWGANFQLSQLHISESALYPQAKPCQDTAL